MASKVLLAQYKMSYLNSPMFFRYIGTVHTHRLSLCKQGTHGAMVCSAVNILWSHLDLFSRLFLLARVSFFCRGRCGARALLRRSCCLQLGTGFLLRGHRLTGPMARRSFHGTFSFGYFIWRSAFCKSVDQGIALGIPLGILQSLRVLQMNTFANSPDVPL